MEKLIDYLKTWYDNAIENNEDMNAKSWGYEEGILITANEAKLIIDRWEAKTSDEMSNCNKPLVSGSFCPECNSENIIPYNDTPMECLECHHVWL